MLQRLSILTLSFLLLIGCQQFPTNTANTPLNQTQSQQNQLPEPPPVPVQVVATPLQSSAPCTNRFTTHNLDHTTVPSTKVVGLYESNGSGVGINDLDNDGDLDIVLANLGANNSILWNEGNLRFRPQRLAHGGSRAVSIVDVDGDDWLDIVFTRRFAKPTYWHNTGLAGDSRFVQSELPGVNNPFYSIDWADLDQDGDLDFVAGSYDTELRKEQGGIFEYRGGGVGVFVYTRQNDSYDAERLAEQADALALALPDLNGDGRLDILVGNDFDRPDYTWLQTDDGWAKVQHFSAMTENTMSFDIGDVDNDGTSDIFATDMKPYSQDEQTMSTWQPLMEMMSHPTSGDDPQVVENVLQIRGVANSFENQANERVVAATGWSWSSKFGDLDNDGHLDIYAVNGMIAEGLLDHLPNQELIEENQALHNDGQGYFSPAPEWGLGATTSGRGMSMADLDNDGDLDIVVNNLLSSAQLFENQLCGGLGLTLDLRWPNSQNPFAIGAQITLSLDNGDNYHRTVRVNSGYLSGDPSRVHFGLPGDAMPSQLTIRWPDGGLSQVTTLDPQTHLTIQRIDE